MAKIIIFWNFIKKHWDTIKDILLPLLLISSLCLAIYEYKINKGFQSKIEATDNNGDYKAIYTDSDIDNLKQENAALYDSIKAYKDEISYLIQFKYKKTYKTDTVYTQAPLTEQAVKTYNYSNSDSDTINYKLAIGSTTEPNWYKLDINVTDNFTIINKKLSGNNEITIQTENNGTITDVTTFNKKTKTSFWKRFKYGPQVTGGYDVINKKFGLTIGFGGTFNIGKE